MIRDEFKIQTGEKRKLKQIINQ